MLEGQLVCSGTQSDLKAEYPCGMSISFILGKMTNTKEQKLEMITMLRALDSSFAVKTITEEMMTITYGAIPIRLNEIFEYISKVKYEYGIVDYSVSTTSLEDVLLKINTKKLSSTSFNEDVIKDSLFGLSNTINQDYHIDLKPKKVSFLFEVFINVKRGLLCLLRQKTALFIETVLCLCIGAIVFVPLTTLSLITTSSTTSLSSYFRNSKGVFYSHSPSAENALKYFAVGSYKKISFNDSVSPNDDDLRLIDSALFNQSVNHLEKSFMYFRKSTEELIEVKSLYSSHLYPFNFANNNFLISTFLKNEYGINTKLIESFSITLSRGINYPTLMIVNAAFIVPLVIVLITFCGCNIASPLNKGTNQIKQFLYLSGANMIAYWISRFIVDTVKILLFLLLLFPALYKAFDCWLSLLLLLFQFSLANNAYLYLFLLIPNEDTGKKCYLYATCAGIFIARLLPWVSISEFVKALFIFLQPSLRLLMLGDIWLMFIRNKFAWESLNSFLMMKLLFTPIQLLFYGSVLAVLEMDLIGRCICRWNSRVSRFFEKDSNQVNLLQDTLHDIDAYYSEGFDQLSMRKEFTTRVRGISTYSKEKTALRNISLLLEPNEKFALLGEKGSGKTLLFKALTKTIAVDSGSVHFYNHDLEKDWYLIRQNMGYCPQEEALFDYLTVEETLVYYSQLKGAETVIEDMAKSFRLDGHLRTLCLNLSLGNKKKLLLAIALMNNPKILLLDEPSTGVDADSQRAILKAINDISKRNISFNVIMATKSIEEAELLCNKVGWMRNGALAISGHPEYLKLKFSEGYFVDITYKSTGQLVKPKEKAFIMDYVYKHYFSDIHSDALFRKELISNPAIDQLKELIDYLKPFCCTIAIVPHQRRDLSFRLKVKPIESCKNQLFAYLLSLKDKKDIEEVSVTLKPLKRIFELYS